MGKFIASILSKRKRYVLVIGEGAFLLASGVLPGLLVFDIEFRWFVGGWFWIGHGNRNCFIVVNLKVINF